MSHVQSYGRFWHMDGRRNTRWKTRQVLCGCGKWLHSNFLLLVFQIAFSLYFMYGLRRRHGVLALKTQLDERKVIFYHFDIDLYLTYSQLR